MADFLLELRCEEIPARMQAGARAELEKLFRRELEAAGVAAGELTIWSTPRRLALIARGLPLATQETRTEIKGPRVGAPDQAIDGFLRRYLKSREDLVEKNGIYFLDDLVTGRPIVRVLQEAIPAIIRDFSWPKSMRWGAASITTDSLRWVRPLSGIVALLDDEVVSVAIDGIESGRETYGHRFHSSRAISITNADDYPLKLLAANVIVDQSAREMKIRHLAHKVAAEAGLTLVADEGLVIENAGLTEWPVPLLGRFDEAFLDVPPEVIQLTARVNQKYFVCESTDGKLANAFICTANIEAIDPAVVVDGNRKVLAARLSDARFFWEQDQKTPLADHAKKLSRITFHEKLGTVADKVERVAKLARWLCEEGIVAGDPALAEQAARLCKADLVTEMVGEFPELQGLMGGYYAAKEGLPQEVAEAIRDHYKPVGQGDEVPTAPVTVAVSLADKLDTLVGFFAIDEKPTGSKDPFALRRAAIGIIQIIHSGLRLELKIAFGRWFSAFNTQEITREFGGLIPYLKATEDFDKAEEIFEKTGQPNPYIDPSEGRFRVRDLDFDAILDFFADRLKVQQREAGVRHDLIDAVFALGGEDDLVRLLARVHALQAFVTTEDGTNLLAGYKRAANILKKEGFAPGEGAQALSYTPEPAEKALIDALDAAAPRAAEAVEQEKFADAMAALATLRAPIDRFFEEVTVNAEEAEKRTSRLALLAAFRDAVHRVADFSRIEG